ncbi:MAG: universal stress protein [Thermoanaerobaculia bacterium]
MKRIRNILVATDFSSASRPAFRRAVEMAAASRATLWIGHVMPSVPASAGGDLLPRMYREMDLFIRDDAEKRLRALTKAACRRGARARPLLLRGVPHEAIGRAARAHRADLVVLGTHGRTGVARFLIGSVAARVLATAPCPVLTVRPR